MTSHHITGVDGRQDLLFTVRARDEQELVLLPAVYPRDGRGELDLFVVLDLTWVRLDGKPNISRHGIKGRCFYFDFNHKQQD